MQAIGTNKLQNRTVNNEKAVDGWCDRSEQNQSVNIDEPKNHEQEWKLIANAGNLCVVSLDQFYIVYKCISHSSLST